MLVDRLSTVKNSFLLSRTSSPICLQTASRYFALTPPEGVEGVPTQTSATSVSSTALAASVVAVIFPSACICVTISGRPSSMIGHSPRFSRSTLASATSTPTTVWPSFARQAQLTAPT